MITIPSVIARSIFVPIRSLETGLRRIGTPRLFGERLGEAVALVTPGRRIGRIKASTFTGR